MFRYRSRSSSRRKGRPSRLKSLLAHDSSLSALNQHALEIQSLKNTLWPFLPPSIRAHCDLANFRDATLVLVADSPLWAAKARHASPQILHAARQRCKIPAKRVVTRIRVGGATQPPARVERPLTATARRHLKNAAQGTSDPELKAILERMAGRK